MTIDGPLVVENDTENRFFWNWDGRANRPLQIFFYTKEWTAFSSRQKQKWLTHAQRGGTILSSTIKSIGQDQCEWTVVKRYDEDLNLGTPPFACESSKIIRIIGLTDFLATAAKKP